MCSSDLDERSSASKPLVIPWQVGQQLAFMFAKGLDQGDPFMGVFGIHGSPIVASMTGPTGKLYLAYLRDPDGNKLCALHRPG